jgi:hypothetical protein
MTELPDTAVEILRLRKDCRQRLDYFWGLFPRVLLSFKTAHDSVMNSCGSKILGEWCFSTDGGVKFAHLIFQDLFYAVKGKYNKERCLRSQIQIY